MAARHVHEHFARTFLASGAARGLDPAALCGGAVPLSGAFDGATLSNISRNTKLMLDDELCGLSHRPLPVGPMALMCEVATLSGTLGDALQRAFRIYGIATDAVGFDLEPAGALATIAITAPTDANDPDHVLPDWWLYFWHRFAQWLIGETVQVQHADFIHAPATQVQDYADLLGASCVRFETARTRLSFAHGLLGRRISRTVQDVRHYMSPRPFNINLAQGGDGLAPWMRSRMRAHLELHRVMPKLEILAEEQHVSAQTLRRRLDAVGIVYRDLKACVRREVALDYLADQSIPIGEVSVLAGFAESNGLSRAVRAWAGVSPSRYRERVAGMAT